MSARLSLLATLSLALTACSPPAVSQEEAPGEPPATFDITLDPALSAWPQLEERLTSEAETERNAFLATADSDYRAWQAEDSEWDWRPYEAEIAWSVAWSNDTTVSLLGTFYEYTGGAHPNHGVSSLLWDVGTASVVSLEDLFTDASPGAPAMRALREAVLADLMAQKRERLGEMFDEAAEREFWLDGLAADSDAFATFTLAPSTEAGHAGGLIIHYGPYEVGSYAEGDYNVLVPQAVFAPWLDADRAALFAGEPDVDPVDLQP